MALVLKEDDPIPSAQRPTCSTNEVTAGLQAQIGLRELNALDTPPSMTTLVEETKGYMQIVVDAVFKRDVVRQSPSQRTLRSPRPRSGRE